MSEEASAEPTRGNVTEVKDEPEAEPSEQEELTVHENPAVQLISSDGNITQKKLGESRVHLTGTDEIVASPLTEESQRALTDLTTLGMLQRELHDSEVRVKNAEQRALEAEEALQAALDKIQDLEREQEGRPSVKPKNNEEERKIPPEPSPKATSPAPSKKLTPKPASSKKRTKRQ